MSASSPERSPAARLGLVLLALIACTHRDVETRPFHLEVAGPDGRSLAEGFTGPSLLVLSGIAAVPGPTTFVLGGAVRITDPADPSSDTPVGDVTVRFDGTAAAEVAFPGRLAGQPVLLEVLVGPGSTGPVGEPLPVWVVRLATGSRLAPTYELSIGEGTAVAGNGLPGIPALLGRFFGDEDLPTFQVEANWTEYEPAECGLVYLDALRVLDADPELTLRAGATGRVIAGLRPDPLVVRHVLSWHRRGRCSGQAGTWTQIAAWR